jgi:iron-sulfur cluster assembly accessory protein
MIKLTEKAALQIKLLIEKEDEFHRHLRVQVVGGGCSGLSYKLKFESNITNSDKVFNSSGINLVVDSKSQLFLKGLELDFSDGLDGQGFVFNNPNAKKTCGCGTSFSA